MGNIHYPNSENQIQHHVQDTFIPRSFGFCFCICTSTQQPCFHKPSLHPIWRIRKMWDNEAKKVIYGKFDPNAARSTLNFNPFETFEGNSPDASGKYPGEPFYKDPSRGDVSYASMQIEKAEIDERNANPKPGYAAGCAGCKN